MMPSMAAILILFLSTLSLRRATISARREASEPIDFYPRSPCGERPGIFLNLTSHKHFYPRSPCGERRDVIAVMTDAQSISIHALLAESDSKSAQNSGALLRI